MAIPNFDRGSALNMTVFFRREPEAFDPEQFPELVLRSNLFGQATHNLVLSEQLKQAYEFVDHELKIVADIQRSLLPKKLPSSPKLTLAADYHTSRHAGGDYYDVFELPDGSLGILIADVSGHGTPAAVMMAITHSIAHSFPGPPDPPEKMLNFINDQLIQHYMSDNETFVTAFYGVIDPTTRSIRFACAGHNPPRLKSCLDGTIRPLDGHCGLPLGVSPTKFIATTSKSCDPAISSFFIPTVSPTPRPRTARCSAWIASTGRLPIRRRRRRTDPKRFGRGRTFHPRPPRRRRPDDLGRQGLIIETSWNL